MAESKVTDLHQQYVEFAPQWEKISDVLGGADRMRANSHKYFTQSASHIRNQRLYAEYVNRAMFASMTSRTLDALTGAIFRKPPVVEVPRHFEPRLASVSGRADDIDTFCKRVCRQVLSHGRVGLLTTVAEQPDPWDPLARLPKVVVYPADAITNWRVTYLGAEEVLSQVILKDSETVETEFGTATQPAFLVLELIQGAYVARRFSRVDGEEYAETARIVPTDTLGRPLSRIPFVFANASDLGADVTPSPLAPLADVDVAWMRGSADQEAALHKLAFPIPVLIGVDDSQTTWSMGPDTIWLLPHDADAKMLEFSGQGLQPLADSLTQKERTASMLGARLLAAPKKAAETAESVRLQASGETSVISSVAHTVSAAITASLQTAVTWAGIPGTATCTLNQDFLDTVIASDELRELRETALSGLLPFDDFVLALQRGEVIRSNLSVEEVRSLLESDPIPSTAQPMRLDQPVDQAVEQVVEPPIKAVE